MILKGNKTVNYTIEGEKGQIVAEVELKQIDELRKPGQNVWYGVAILNDKNLDHPDLPYCVNAQYMAEQIVDEEIKKLRAEHGTKLRIKRK